MIGFKVLLFVAAQGPLANEIDARFAAGLPPAVVGGALRAGPKDVDYSGDGATYRIRWDIIITE